MTKAEICGQCRCFDAAAFPIAGKGGMGRCCIKLPPHVARVVQEHDDQCFPLNVVYDTDTCALFKPIEP